MAKWPLRGSPKRFQVKVKAMRLEGFEIGAERGESRGQNKVVMAVEVIWKRSTKSGFVSFHRKSQQLRSSCSKLKCVKNGEAIEWDDEFENLCSFSKVSKDTNSFSPWILSFNILFGRSEESRSKLKSIGKISLNLAEFRPEKDSEINRKVPFALHADGAATDVTLSVTVTFSEVRDSLPRINSYDPLELATNLADSNNEESFRTAKQHESSKSKMKNKTPEDEVTSSSNSEESAPSDNESRSDYAAGPNGQSTESNSMRGFRSLSSSETQIGSVDKVKFWKWKRRRSSSEAAKRNVESFSENKSGASPDSRQKGEVNEAGNAQCESCTTDGWETRELVSRDGKTRLKSNVFFASYDQRSEKAAGASACTAIVTVIADWLQSNRDKMPTRSEFNRLIFEGSLEWRKLCDNEAHKNDFPDKHFDLETILKAELRPVSILQEKSFIGFFCPENFEFLKEAKSFDTIWNEINENAEDHVSRVYILSWNDHFFILKVEANAYYIIDSLGERLYEGCCQAYILKFDDSSFMFEKAEGDRLGLEVANEGGEIMCKGKECCREYMKRFLVAIPIRELQEEEEKGTVSIFSLHRRLQIEFHFSSPSSASSTTTSSIEASPTSAFFSNEEHVVT